MALSWPSWRSLTIAVAALAAVAALGRGMPGIVASPAAPPTARGAAAVQPQASFADQVAGLSEPGGYFDTDNLISNERSYLQVLPELRRGGVRGGAYVGVGPDTNFSYIADIRPAVAFIVDIRRDNLLLHLLFKALFELAPTRIEYLSLLLGRTPPQAIDGWRGAPIDRLIAHVDRAAAVKDVAALRQRVDAAIAKTRVPLSAGDLATIARFHRRFMDEGLDLQFNSAGRAPHAYYPAYRDLLLETGADGVQANYLASEDAFQFVKSLQARDLVIPVVGDLGGSSAMPAIARAIAARHETLSALYASNVEFYLFGQGAFPRFAANLRQMPRSARSVLIRAVFSRGYGFGLGRPGDASVSQLASVNDLLAAAADGQLRSYGELISRKQ